jgi:NAD(P)-dependent dehydrogenase (short-subunit alcohol dehydrogenase family)
MGRDNTVERFADRVAVITGGASGIGRASAVRLAAEGATVVIVDLNEKAGKALADELGGSYLAADVTSQEDNERIYQQTHATYGRIDVAFHNAGISPPDDDSILDTGLEAWKRVQDVNLTSCSSAARRCCRTCCARGAARSSTPASFVATLGGGDVADLLHREQGRGAGDDPRARRPVRPAGGAGERLSPGPVATPLLMELFASDPERAQRRLVHVPVGRFAEPSGDRGCGGVPGQ